VVLAGIDNPIAVAASSTFLAVAQVTATLARVLVYDLGGTLVVTIGGAPLPEGDSCCAGTRLGMPSSLSVCVALIQCIPNVSVFDVVLLWRVLHPHANCACCEETVLQAMRECYA
jgi:hypothetical protein